MADARRLVDSMQSRGFDFVKVLSFLPREVFLAILAEAKQRGIQVAGHVPFGVSADEASAAGLHSVEHLTGIALACSTAMRRAEVPLLAGTDVQNPYVFPGFSLHEELALLVEAGLTPAEALRTATLNPAIFLEATDSLGTVDVGKVADLVLLDADPLIDIRNTTRIRGVLLRGRYLDRRVLDSLLAGAARAANH